MQIIVSLERTKEQRKITLSTKATVADLLTALSLNPQTVLVTRKGTVLIEQHPLKDKDNIKILSVVSGG